MDKVYYYNRDGALKLTLNETPYYCGDAVFKDWVWSYDNQFGNLKSFRRDKVEYPLTITITTNSTTARDDLCDIFTDDVLAGSPGYIMIRDWRLPCYVVEAEHDFFGTLLDHQIAFKIVSETSTWVRETSYHYNGVDTTGSVNLGRDYSKEEGDTVSARGYDENSTTASFLMDSFGDTLIDSDSNSLIDSNGATETIGYGYSMVSDYTRLISLPTDGNGFRVTFYGAVTNPEIYLDGKPVRVYTSIADGEQLEITSNGRERTIYKLSATGEKTNYFVYRDKTYSPFFSIDRNTTLSYGNVNFDFVTIEQRSEPSWT